MKRVRTNLPFGKPLDELEITLVLTGYSVEPVVACLLPPPVRQVCFTNMSSQRPNNLSNQVALYTYSM